MVTVSMTEREKTLPGREQPKTDTKKSNQAGSLASVGKPMCATSNTGDNGPRYAWLCKESVDPRVIPSKSDARKPNRVTPGIKGEGSRRECERKNRAKSSLKKSKADAADPTRPQDLVEIDRSGRKRSRAGATEPMHA